MATQLESPLPAAPRTPIYRALELLVWLVASLPILLIKYAPYSDLPSHLARFEVLQRLGDPFYDAYWISNWAPLANLGADLLILGFALVMPTILAMKLGLVVIVGIFGSGFARLHEAWSGRRSLYAFLGYPLAYGMPMSMGFLNYVMGIGLMLWAIAAHLRLRGSPKGRYFAVMIPLTALAALTHMVAFAQTILVVTLLELGGIGRESRPTIRNVPWGRLAPLGVLPIVLLLVTPKGKSGPTLYLEPFLKMKLSYFEGALQMGSGNVDRLFLAGCFALLAALCVGGFRWSRGVLLLLGTLLVLYVATPYAIYTMYFLDVRQPWVLLTLALALVAPLAASRAPRGLGSAVLGAFAALFLLRTAVLGRAHARRSAEMDRVARTFFGPLPEGSLLLSSYGDDESWDSRTWEPPLLHLGSLALFYNRVYPNTIFAIAGQQPLAVRPELAALQKVPIYAEPRFPAQGIRDLQRARAGLPSAWRNRPAFVFFVAGSVGATSGPGATLVAHEGRWGLYRLADIP